MQPSLGCTAPFCFAYCFSSGSASQFLTSYPLWGLPTVFHPQPLHWDQGLPALRAGHNSSFLLTWIPRSSGDGSRNGIPATPMGDLDCIPALDGPRCHEYLETEPAGRFCLPVSQLKKKSLTANQEISQDRTTYNFTAQYENPQTCCWSCI